MKIAISDKRGISVGVYHTPGTDDRSPRLVLPTEDCIADLRVSLDNLDVELEVFNKTEIRGCNWSEISTKTFAISGLRAHLLGRIEEELKTSWGLSIFRFRSVVDSPDGMMNRTFLVNCEIIAANKEEAEQIRRKLFAGEYHDNVLIF